MNRQAGDNQKEKGPEDKGLLNKVNKALSSLIPQPQGKVRLDPSKDALIPSDELVSGGPPPDGIPPIDAPNFVSIEEARAWLDNEEPVIALGGKKDPIAYPLQILIWHEIVNTDMEAEPVVVTFCPLCTAAVVYSRRVGGQILDFGTSGFLYNSDLVMYDRQTRSLWSQIPGLAVSGEFAGEQLTPVAFQVVDFETWAETFPEGKVLSKVTGKRRPYGRNPYPYYDQSYNAPMMYRGEMDERLKPMERVLGIRRGEDIKAYRFDNLARDKVLEDVIAGQEVVILFDDQVKSVVGDPDIHHARQVGAATAYDPETDGKRLSFKAAKGNLFIDNETGSTWTSMGVAIKGKLAGTELAVVPSTSTLWFAWAAFFPNTEIYTRN